MPKNPSLSDAVHSAAQPEPTPRAPGATKSLILRLPAELHRDLRQLRPRYRHQPPGPRRGGAGEAAGRTPVVSCTPDEPGGEVFRLPRSLIAGMRVTAAATVDVTLISAGEHLGAVGELCAAGHRQDARGSLNRSPRRYWSTCTLR